MKHYYKILSSIFTFLLLFAIFVWLFYSQTALSIIANTLQEVVPGKLEIIGLEGTIAGPIKIAKFSYQQDKLTIDFENLVFDWQPSTLFAKKLTVKELHAENIKIQLQQQDRNTKQSPISLADKSFSLTKGIYLPNRYSLENISLHNIALNISQIPKPIVINDLKLATKGTLNSLESIDVDLIGPGANVAFRGALNPTYNFNWKIAIDNLNNFLPIINGAINSEGYIRTQDKQIQTKAVFKLDNFKYKHFAVSHSTAVLDLNAETMLGQINLSFAKITTPDCSVSQINIKNTVKVNVLQKNNINLNIDTEFAPFTLLLLHNSDYPKLSVRKIHTVSELKNKNIKVVFNVEPERQSPLTGNFGLTNDKQVTGDLHWQTRDLSPILKLLPAQLQKTSGILDAAVNVKGTLDKLEWGGKILLSNLAAYFPLLNLQVDRSNLDVEFNQTKINYTGKVYSDDKFISVIGITQLSDILQNSANTTIKIIGKDFPISNTNLAQINVSPNLALTIKQGKIVLDGDVFIPKAKINTKEINDVTTLPNDVVFIDDAKSATLSQNYNFYSKLNLLLGEDINLKIMGLEGRLIGHLSIEDQPEKPTQATGVLSIKDGVYNIYGQKLTIRQGNLNFSSSPIDNPSMDVEAVRNIKPVTATTMFDLQNKQVVVGVRIQGQLNNPQSTLFSEPNDLAQEDILSYLIIGQPSSQIGDNQVGLIFNAIQALNFGGVSKFTNLTDTLQKRLGLSELGIESETINEEPISSKEANKNGNLTATTSLVLGKYLTPSLYVGYSVSLLDQVNIFRVRYKLWKNFTIQTESSTLGTGVDLLYNIVRN